MPSPKEVDIQYRQHLDGYLLWEEQEKERQDKIVASAMLQLRERNRYFNPLRWLRDRVRWMRWFSWQ